MKNKEADTELESRLLEILVHPCRIEDIRRELPNAGKNNLKNALDALVADGRVMKNKKNRFAVSAHYGCAARNLSGYRAGIRVCRAGLSGGRSQAG